MYHFNVSCLVDDVAVRFSDRPALRYPEQTYSYDELFSLVESLSALLLIKGFQRGDVVAIAHNKKPLSYALMLAALRLGIAYVNIDTASPTARNSLIIKVSGARLLFYDDACYGEAVADLVANCGCEQLLLSHESLPVVSPADRELQKRQSAMADGSSIAYIMFTSGSTGTPKGVAVTHQNILHFMSWGRNCFNITDQDNFANLSPMYFDNSVFDFYVALFSGASITPIPRELLNAPYELVNHVAIMNCTIWFSVPSLLIYLMTMKALASTPLPSLRHIIFGGEGYPKPELKKLYDLFSSQASLVNVYGPTECTCICSAHRLSEKDFAELDGLPTLGFLNPNFDYMILDEKGDEAKCGELCLIGPNVAAGYFNDPERTATSFITLNDPRRFMKRMYRTGDLVRESGGHLFFMGRKDNQIKHMGYRIELEEIENALVKLPNINQAAVFYHKPQNTAYGKIVGFVASTSKTDEQFLLTKLSDLLPGYMIPHKIIINAELPKNPNGKIDRHLLSNMIQK